ncbi:MAG TPA: hypothetical protein VGJ93_00035 [Desulfuromonadaceae bacterium]|jgi:hypothetical protein
MPSIKVDQLVASMLQAAKGELAQKWPEAKDYAEAEFRKIGEMIAYIEAQRTLNLMSDEKARLHLEMQKNAACTLLLTVKGIGSLAVEAAINAALDVVKTA